MVGRNTILLARVSILILGFLVLPIEIGGRYTRALCRSFDAICRVTGLRMSTSIWGYQNGNRWIRSGNKVAQPWMNLLNLGTASTR